MLFLLFTFVSFHFVGIKRFLVSSVPPTSLKVKADRISLLFLFGSCSDLIIHRLPRDGSLLHYWHRKAVCQPSHHPWWLILCWTPSYSSLYTNHPPQLQFFISPDLLYTFSAVRLYSSTFCCFEFVLQDMWSLWLRIIKPQGHFMWYHCKIWTYRFSIMKKTYCWDDVNSCFHGVIFQPNCKGNQHCCVLLWTQAKNVG